MNPSNLGWINRYLSTYEEDLQDLSKLTLEDFYKRLRNSGFIYGTNLTIISKLKNEDFKLTQEELAKVNLFTSLLIVYRKNKNENDIFRFLKSIITFYESLKKSNSTIFSFTWKTKKIEQQVENILHQRVQTNDTFIQKNFSNIVTNALLFVDVLAYSNFLKGKDQIHYAAKLEELLVNAVFFAVKKKKFKGKYDSIVIKLLQSSLRFHEINDKQLEDLKHVEVRFLRTYIEKQYLVDVICMTLYTDEHIDENEKEYVLELGQQLNFSSLEINDSIQFMYDFVEKNKSYIYYFNISNPVKYFYDKTYRSVSVLLRRNRKRILKEIYESKELMQLLVSSTYRELDAVEKKKVKSQLMDIFKTIPSLTIFALPGGSLLLPIIIKMIPTILPSSFNENNEIPENKFKN